MFLALLLCQAVICISPARAQSAPGVGVRLPDLNVPSEGNTGVRMGDHTVQLGTQRNLLITVLNDAKSRLDRQSVVKLHDKTRDVTVWQTTDSESEITFYDLNLGDYDIEVSALGYLPEHKDLRISTALYTFRVEIALQRDPSAVDLSIIEAPLSSKARKEAKRALQALGSGNLEAAQKHLDSAYKLAPASSQVNFLYGYLFWQRRKLQESEDYLNRAAQSDPRELQILTLLGRVQLERDHFEDARKTLEKAIAINSEYWMAHNLLADAYLRLQDYEKAREQAQVAIEKGKAAGSVAQLILGEALANLGRDQEGIEALKAFLKDNPNNPAAPQARELIATIENRELKASPSAKHQDIDLALTASRFSLPASAWGPPGVDDVKPSVAAGLTCPYQQVLEQSGARVKQLVDDIARFAAIEDMVHEQLDQVGHPVTKETRKFQYVATISEDRPGYLSTDEYRNLHYGAADLPDGIATTGFVTLALIFHPNMRENFEMTCEGLGDWRGQATWLMHFRQRDDKPNRFANYVAGGQRYPLNLKGRAWITAKSFQIVRIESELVSPAAKLTVQHSIVDYGPVRFAKKNVDLWLPQAVDIYIELNRRRYYRRHSFDNYMLFSVNSEDRSPVLKGSGGGPQQEP